MLSFENLNNQVTMLYNVPVYTKMNQSNKLRVKQHKKSVTWDINVILARYINNFPAKPFSDSVVTQSKKKCRTDVLTVDLVSLKAMLFIYKQ